MFVTVTVPILVNLVANIFLKNIDYKDKILSAAATVRSELVKNAYEAMRGQVRIVVQNQQLVEGSMALRAGDSTVVDGAPLYNDSTPELRTRLVETDEAMRLLETELTANAVVDVDMAPEGAAAKFQSSRLAALSLLRDVRACLAAPAAERRVRICVEAIERHFVCPDDSAGKPAATCQSRFLATHRLLDTALDMLRLLPVKPVQPWYVFW
jgi:hypothetical protein